MFLYLRKEYPSEDALTGVLADVLSWSAQPELVQALLAGAWTFDDTRTRHRSAPVLPPWSTYHVEPWPQWPTGEPDIVLRLLDASELRAIVVIEAKLGAAKSGIDGDDEPLPAPNEGDQLGRYFAHATCLSPCARVIYLTHHVLPPEEDLRASYASMRKRLQTAAPEQLQWLSWRHVEQVLREASQVHHDRAFARCLEGVAAVLRGIGFHSFAGRWGGGTQQPGPVPTMVWWRSRGSRAYRWPGGPAIGRVPPRFYRGSGANRYTWAAPARRHVARSPAVVFWKGGGSP